MTLSAALQGFRTVLAGLTFPTSGNKLFADAEGVYFGTDNEMESRRYPQAVIRRAGSTNLSANHSGLWQGQISVEVRQDIKVRDMSNVPGILFGQNRTSDEVVGAGIEDIVERLVSQTNFLNSTNNANIKPFIRNPRVGEVQYTEQYAYCVVTYDAVLAR